MQDLIKQEQFELEVLDRLNSGKFLDQIVLGGGTMLRLCLGLNRFSVDLDFWILKDLDINKVFADLKAYLAGHYEIKDAADKFYSLVFEIRSKDFPRSLKIEIRKETKKIKTERMIAYSKYSNTQVFLRVVSLKEMMSSKITAFLDRKEIRDVFDMEFLLRKGVTPDISSQTANKILRGIDALTRKDYTVKLGSLLEDEQRKYYISENFKILKAALKESRVKS
ncbi:MAG: nucleotidyl transferase AbiEii/AbiGii toxin family protein [Nitrospirae bacterium]|nr:nucleotidyl transferase AbiEii/AbiGii toxin family protein [Nitrospirota bacterium]